MMGSDGPILPGASTPHSSGHGPGAALRRAVRGAIAVRPERQRPLPRLLRLALAALLGVAGVGHFTNTGEFLAQVPPYLPAPELLILVSGIVELALAAGLVLLPRWRGAVALAVALFFVAILPGNIAQFTEARDAFGLDSDLARGVRLALHPLLWLWAFTAGDLLPRRRSSL
jgi:uncharacterized membrane protein